MFEKIPEGSPRNARNFDSLLLADGPETDASNYNFTAWANQLEIESPKEVEQENPNLAGKMINWIYCIGTEYWSDRIPNIEDPIWRKEAELEMVKRITAVEEWNRANPDSTPKPIDPIWRSILGKIRFVETQIESHGRILDLGEPLSDYDSEDDESDASYSFEREEEIEESPLDQAMIQNSIADDSVIQVIDDTAVEVVVNNDEGAGRYYTISDASN